MEVLDSLVFVQGFVWITLLLKKPYLRGRLIVVAQFLLICLLYLLNYFNNAGAEITNSILFPVLTIIIVSTLSLFQDIEISGNYSIKRIIIWSMITIVTIFLVVFCTTVNEIVLFRWVVVLLFGITLFVYDSIVLLNQYKMKKYTARFVNSYKYRTLFFMLVFKFVIMISAMVVMVFMYNNSLQVDTFIIIFHILVALAVFVVGYNSVLKYQKDDSIYKPKTVKSANNSTTQKVEDLMINEKPYLDCELTLEKLADMLLISDHELTEILNHEMGTNFYGLINGYRIKTVKEKLKESGNRRFTILACAYESGFNSKSTFYRIFKEYTNLTPKEYCEHKST